jgi:hypothetical protein
MRRAIPASPRTPLSTFGGGVALLLLLACGKLFSIDVEETAVATVTRGTLLEDLLGELGFAGFLDMDITSAEEIQNQGVAPGDIQDVTLTDFFLTVTDPEGGDLSFLSSMAVYVESPGLERVMIASQDQFPTGVTVVPFRIEDVDLTEYVVSQSTTITTEVEGHRPEEDTTIEATFALSIGVTGQGCRNAGKNGNGP